MRTATFCFMLFVITSSAFSAPIKFIHTGKWLKTLRVKW